MLIWVLCTMFALMVLSGIGLTAWSMVPRKVLHQSETSPSEVDLRVDPRGVRVNIATAAPGILIFLMGASGLTLLLFKVPVRWVLGYRSPKSTGGAAFLLRTTIAEAILSDEIAHIPLPVWWLIKKQRSAVRLNQP